MVNNPAKQNEMQETGDVLTRENVRTAINITAGGLSLTLAALVYKYVQYIEIVVDLPIKERRRFDKFFKECPQAKPLLDTLAQDVVSKKEYDKLVNDPRFREVLDQFRITDDNLDLFRKITVTGVEKAIAANKNGALSVDDIERLSLHIYSQQISLPSGAKVGFNGEQMLETLVKQANRMDGVGAVLANQLKKIANEGLTTIFEIDDGWLRQNNALGLHKRKRIQVRKNDFEGEVGILGHEVEHRLYFHELGDEFSDTDLNHFLNEANSKSINMLEEAIQKKGNITLKTIYETYLEKYKDLPEKERLLKAAESSRTIYRQMLLTDKYGRMKIVRDFIDNEIMTLENITKRNIYAVSMEKGLSSINSDQADWIKYYSKHYRMGYFSTHLDPEFNQMAKEKFGVDFSDGVFARVVDQTILNLNKPELQKLATQRGLKEPLGFTNGEFEQKLRALQIDFAENNGMIVFNQDEVIDVFKKMGMDVTPPVDFKRLKDINWMGIYVFDNQEERLLFKKKLVEKMPHSYHDDNIFFYSSEGLSTKQIDDIFTKAYGEMLDPKMLERRKKEMGITGKMNFRLFSDYYISKMLVTNLESLDIPAKERDYVLYYDEDAVNKVLKQLNIEPNNLRSLDDYVVQPEFSMSASFTKTEAEYIHNKLAASGKKSHIIDMGNGKFYIVGKYDEYLGDDVHKIIYEGGALFKTYNEKNGIRYIDAQEIELQPIKEIVDEPMEFEAGKKISQIEEIDLTQGQTPHQTGIETQISPANAHASPKKATLSRVANAIQEGRDALNAGADKMIDGVKKIAGKAMSPLLQTRVGQATTKVATKVTTTVSGAQVKATQKIASLPGGGKALKAFGAISKVAKAGGPVATFAMAAIDPNGTKEFISDVAHLRLGKIATDTWDGLVQITMHPIDTGEQITGLVKNSVSAHYEGATTTWDYTKKTGQAVLTGVHNLGEVGVHLGATVNDVLFNNSANAQLALRNLCLEMAGSDKRYIYDQFTYDKYVQDPIGFISRMYVPVREDIKTGLRDDDTLYTVIESGNPARLQAFINAGGDVNQNLRGRPTGTSVSGRQETQYGYVPYDTAFGMAVGAGHMHMASLLYQQGNVPINGTNEATGDTSFMSLMRHMAPDQECEEYYSGTVYDKTPPQNWSEKAKSNYMHALALTDTLLSRDDLNIHATNLAGQDAFMVAAQTGHLLAVDQLKKKGANINRVAKNGSNALHFAVHNQTMTGHLLAMGVNANQVNNQGETPLMVALRKKENINTVAPLLAATNQEGLKALMHSEKHLAYFVRYAQQEPYALCHVVKNPLMTKAMIEMGFDVTQKNPEGQTPLMLALSGGDECKLTVAVLLDGLDQKGLDALAKSPEQMALLKKYFEKNPEILTAILTAQESPLQQMLALAYPERNQQVKDALATVDENKLTQPTDTSERTGALATLATASNANEEGKIHQPNPTNERV